MSANLVFAEEGNVDDFFVCCQNKIQDDYVLLEFFSGVARIARLSSWVGYKSAAYDIEYDDTKSSRSGRSVMDLNSDAGYMCLDCGWWLVLLYSLV